jgi:hypothetical protein
MTEPRLNRVDETVMRAVLVVRHESDGGPTQDQRAIWEAVVEERFTIVDGGLVVEVQDRSRAEPGVYRVHVYSVEPADPALAKKAREALPRD